MAVRRGRRIIICELESERQLSWGDGQQILCLDTGKKYTIISGVFVEDGGGSGYDGNPTTIVQDSNHRFVSDTEKSTWNAKEDGGAAATAEANANNYTDSEISTLDSQKLDVPTGTPDGTKYLRDDNTWQPVTGGSGLTQSEVLKRLSFRI